MGAPLVRSSKEKEKLVEEKEEEKQQEAERTDEVVRETEQPWQPGRPRAEPISCENKPNQKSGPLSRLRRSHVRSLPSPTQRQLLC